MPKLDFSRLTATEFEQFTYHLICRLGFVNVDWRKGTGLDSSPADSGRDIVAQQIRDDVDKSKCIETWFVDCKHYKKGVPPGDIQNLLAWAEAERPHTALIVASGFLSNPAKDYIEKYVRQRKPPFRVKYWEYPQLEKMTVNKRSLIMEYGLSLAKIRSVKDIAKWENEFCDVIWYDRKCVHLQNIKQGLETIDPKVKKMMLASMRKTEMEYGKAKLKNYYKDTFEWGMLNGKLSALRWVLGDDWDMLDT